MPRPTLVLIAAPDLIPALRDRLGSDAHVVTFGDSEPLRAMRAILTVRPATVVLERLFAASPRGAALMARIKSDPSLEQVEIRILSHDSAYERVSPRRRADRPATSAARPVRPLDAGTRRAPRFEMKESTRAAVDGKGAQLVNLSVIGAQLVVPGTLKPKHGVTVTLGARKSFDTAGTIVWARVELSRKGPTSRIGIEFVEPDWQALTAFIEAHRRGPAAAGPTR